MGLFLFFACSHNKNEQKKIHFFSFLNFFSFNSLKGEISASRDSLANFPFFFLFSFFFFCVCVCVFLFSFSVFLHGSGGFTFADAGAVFRVIFNVFG